jgi:hypothetical protein
MTYEPSDYGENAGAPDRACGLCGHRSEDHVEQEVEEPGGTERAIYCTECEDWHSFVPLAEA